jgi:hypothetical protein
MAPSRSSQAKRKASSQRSEACPELSTIRSADKIMALEGGRIREVGDHEASLSRGGLYSQLYRRQIELAAVGPGEAVEE